ncbi:MAG: DUF1634 domain-containing protein [Thaumarchaeota archaeon]|nr:DUF1634 domain-containing protein [Nitrososphaerota archaeon]
MSTGNGGNRMAGRMELVLSTVLRWGMLLSAVVVGLGAVLMFMTGHSGYGAGLDISRLLFYDDSKVPHRFYPTNPLT